MEAFWQDNDVSEPPKTVSDDIVDLLFGVSCRRLPIDHAYPLYLAIVTVLPWIEDEPHAAIHSIHGAESGNGWIRPSNREELIYLSRRTRLILRLPKNRIEDARTLENQLLKVLGYDLQLGSANIRLLSKETTLFCRHIAFTSDVSEETALQNAAQMLTKENIKPKKIMTGRKHIIASAKDELTCYSLMISGISVEDSVRLQQHGLGGYQKIGCGIFLPHKGIAAIYEPLQD